VDIAYGEHLVARNGRGLGLEASLAAARLIKAVPFTLSLHLDAEDYICINADYRSCLGFGAGR